MRKRLAKRFVVAASVVSLTAAASLAGAATQGRVIPTGSVTFHKNNEVIATFTDQAPINDSALMTCDQACVVKLSSMSFSIKGGTTFSVRDNEEAVDLYVKEGLASFTVKNVTQKVSFFTPDGRYVSSEGFIAPTSTNSAVKGYMNVSQSQAEIGVSQGGMILATSDGIQTVDEGYTYSVDLNELPATSVGGDVGTGFTTTQKVLIGGGAVAAVGGAAWAIDDANDDGTPTQGSQN